VCTPEASDFYDKGPQPLLWAGSQAASVKLREIV